MGCIGASAHRRIGASAHRRIGASAHRRIGACQLVHDIFKSQGFQRPAVAG
jgi:NADH:ubiquinone oxidoreductase subunit H